MSEAKTLAGAFAKIESHEELCAERYENLHGKLGELKANAASQSKILMGVLLALLGWMALQLWDGKADRPQGQSAPAAAVTQFRDVIKGATE